MKRFSVALLFFLAFAAALASQKDEAKQKLKDANEKCNADPSTAIDSAAMKQWADHGGEKPANAGAHALCMAKSLGWLDENGEVMKESLKQKMVHSISPEKADEVIEHCAVKHNTPEETAEELFKCFKKLAEKHPHHEH